MKDRDQLTTIQKKRLQIGVVFALVVFLLVFFFLNKKSETPTVKNPTVYLQNSKLQVFDETIPLSQFPDKISMHYPYLLVVKPEKKITYIYNLEQKQKEKDVKVALLDYDKGNMLYNEGKATVFNEHSLGVLCENGFIKSNQEILCVTKINPNNVENKLVSVDITTKKQKEVYVSKNLITDIAMINNDIYLGEIDLFNHKSYLLINKDRIEVPNLVSLIYQMNGKPYFASFKSELNKNTESWYLMNGNKAIKQENNKIFLYR